MRNPANRRDFMKLITASALAPSFRGAAGSTQVTNPAGGDFNPRVEKWGVQEIVLPSSKSYSNPFQEVRLECRFSSGSHEVEAEGFYDGDNQWKVRLMPTVEGEWSFKTSSNDSDLNGKAGSFLCSPPRPGNHGPVRVQNLYHFGYADGTPLFVLGTTLYNWIHREEALQQRTL